MEVEKLKALQVKAKKIKSNESWKKMYNELQGGLASLTPTDFKTIAELSLALETYDLIITEMARHMKNTKQSSKDIMNGD